MLAPPPIRVRVFLSWCHRDVALKTDLVERLEPNLAILGGIDFSWWEDSQLEIGEAWRRGILDRLSECDYALLLLSPGFFASRFVTTEELPRIIGAKASARALPVMLRTVPLDGSRTMHGVENAQVFTDAGKSYADLAGALRDRYASNLATAIQGRVQGRGWRRL
ncbi:toll/interleukin-1 receptor domain-containing protein [Mycolicibacterium fluoranthenivorans]|nr:toll/interleukin-1 receptor domain-containing protein [Mycolicibacterium fluoranthenivorans]